MKRAYDNNPEPKKLQVRRAYGKNPEPKKMQVRRGYGGNPEPKKMQVSRAYGKNPESIKMKVRRAYGKNHEHKKMLMRKSYAKNREAKNKTSQMWYRKHRYLVLYRQRIRYYGSTMHMRTTKLVRHALHCTTQKLQNNQLCKQIKLNMTIKKACYSLCEPKLDVKEAYVRKMKKQIASNSTLGGELLCAFRSTCKPLTENIEPTKLKKLF